MTEKHSSSGGRSKSKIHLNRSERTVFVDARSQPSLRFSGRANFLDGVGQIAHRSASETECAKRDHQRLLVRAISDSVQQLFLRLERQTRDLPEDFPHFVVVQFWLLLSPQSGHNLRANRRENSANSPSSHTTIDSTHPWEFWVRKRCVAGRRRR